MYVAYFAKRNLNGGDFEKRTIRNPTRIPPQTQVRESLLGVGYRKWEPFDISKGIGDHRRKMNRPSSRENGCFDTQFKKKREWLW